MNKASSKYPSAALVILHSSTAPLLSLVFSNNNSFVVKQVSSSYILIAEHQDSTSGTLFDLNEFITLVLQYSTLVELVPSSTADISSSSTGTSEIVYLVDSLKFATKLKQLEYENMMLLRQGKQSSIFMMRRVMKFNNNAAYLCAQVERPQQQQQQQAIDSQYCNYYFAHKGGMSSSKYHEKSMGKHALQEDTFFSNKISKKSMVSGLQCISVGVSSSWLLFKDYNVYAWGSKANNEIPVPIPTPESQQEQEESMKSRVITTPSIPLSLRPVNEPKPNPNDISVPTLLPQFKALKLVYITIKQLHGLGYDEEGKLYGWGFNNVSWCELFFCCDIDK